MEPTPNPPKNPTAALDGAAVDQLQPSGSSAVKTPPFPEAAQSQPGYGTTPGALACAPVPATQGFSKLALAAGLLGLAALVASTMIWQRLNQMQGQLARQSADSNATAVEARTLARQAQEQSQAAVARQAVLETRLGEVALQRAQLEELMQSLSRSRDENLVVDIESALRLAQQQTQLTGSAEPLLAALKTADQRISRAAQPRLAPLQRALLHDMDRIRSATVADIPGVLMRLDDLVRLADDLSVANDVARPQANTPAASSIAQAGTVALPPWLQQTLTALGREARQLVRVRRIENPEAVLLSPEQAFFVRENFKLQVLNARMGLLARQFESARADLRSATDTLNKYFDPAARKTQQAATLLQQVQRQIKSVELPRIDETLTALATAAAGR